MSTSYNTADRSLLVVGGAGFEPKFLAQDLTDMLGFDSLNSLGMARFDLSLDAFRRRAETGNGMSKDLVVIIDDPVSETRQQQADELIALARKQEIPVLVFSDRKTIGHGGPSDSGIYVWPSNKARVHPSSYRTELTDIIEAPKVASRGTSFIAGAPSGGPAS